MRTMLKVTVPTADGNRAIKDGALQKAIEATIDRVKPEAAYFTTQDGNRCAMIFFDMQDASDIPGIAEPLFMGLNASIELAPVMNRDDLKKGLAAAMKAM